MLCKLGIHKWSFYQGKSKQIFRMYRKCDKCSKIQEHFLIHKGDLGGNPIG